MIAPHHAPLASPPAPSGVWSALAAPLPPGVVAWRQDGRPIVRDGTPLARFVAYIEANTVRERLDTVVPGEWDLTLELLPSVAGLEDDASQGACSFKARLQVLGVIREDVGTGKDYKQAATDAFKRAAVRFGIAHELYGFAPHWVQLDGDGKYARPIEDPAEAYARRHESTHPATPVERRAAVGPDVSPAGPGHEESCPKCGGHMWDNRATKRNVRAPDFKCRDRTCDGVRWPASRQAAEVDALPV